nr:MAG TPA: hypothetical protein [Bacteriophage sp.]
MITFPLKTVKSYYVKVVILQSKTSQIYITSVKSIAEMLWISLFYHQT